MPKKRVRNVTSGDEGSVGRTGTRAVVGRICERIIAGESVAAVFRKPDPGFPAYSTFWEWLSKDPDLASMVGAAEIAACNALGDRLIDVTREQRNAAIVSEGERDGKSFRETKYVDAVERSKLEADAIKWVLARRLPKKYGEKVTVAGDAENPLVVTDARAALAAAIARQRTPGDAEGGPGSSDSEPDA